MTQPYRLGSGGRIDRSRVLQFSFAGRAYTGYAGDTLASALLANGVRTVSRSFKYHRPRGIMGAGAEEPNAILQIGTGATTVPNLRATQVELVNGLTAHCVNAWPSVERDYRAVAGAFGGMLPAGFYYKTFMWPRRAWHFYESLIRRAAGLGCAPSVPDVDRYEKVNAHCDVLIVGAGPTGLAAALAAARAGARVILADEQSEPGGSLLGSATLIDGQDSAHWVSAALDELTRLPEVTLLSRATVFGYHADNFLTINERVTDHLHDPSPELPRERLWRVRARRVVLATGAIERPLGFANNDLPGVMLASAVSTYVHRYAVAPGRRALVFTNNDSAYQTALDLQAAGGVVSAVVDVRADPDGERARRVRDAGIAVESASAIGAVRRNGPITTAEIVRLSAGGRIGAAAGSLGCDLVAVSGGWNPAVHLHAQSGGRPVFDQDLACFLPGVAVQAEASAGAARGVFALHECLADGFSAGAQAARAAGYEAASEATVPAVAILAEQPLEPLWLVRGSDGEPLPRSFVDYQNDTTAADIVLAAREGYRSIEHVKRYTALGFGTDQGKLGNINGMAILAQTLGQDMAATGTTTFRPNYTPVTFGAIAGRDLGATLFDPVRKTAIHDWHVQHGAEFENVGQWKRPWYYPRAGEGMHEAVNRECRATRDGVGIMDASTLGKIDIVGPDAAKLLNHVYTNAWSKLEIGRCRYGLMLGEDGMVMDDGVTTRLGEHHFHMTTTTGGAAHVLGWLERWLQTEWPELRVYLTSVTDQWAVASVAGPNCRELLAAVCDDIDLTPEAFPFMAMREGTVSGVAARVFRISFSGELAYEINVPANNARHVWEGLMHAGERHEITPYGTEAMHVLRAEKGYVIVGQDTDGSVTPVDLGMQRMLSTKKDFLGRRSLARPDCMRTDRKQLVGLKTEQPNDVLPEGAQLVEEPSERYPVPMIGHVTSSYYSACLGHSIALALIKGGQSRHGAVVYAPLLDGRTVQATITDPVFYDPRGERQHV